MRRLLITLSVLALTLGACSGGGGDGVAPAGSLALTGQNAVAAVARALDGGSGAVDISDAFALIEEELDLDQNGTFPCPGGTYTVSASATSGTITFNGCTFPELGTFTGTMSFTVVNDTTVTFQIDLTVVDAGETTTVAGDMTVSITSSGASALVSTISGTSLSVTEGGQTTAIENYNVWESVDFADGSFEYTMTAYVRDTTLGGSVYVTTPATLTGTLPGHPVAGQLLLEGSGRSRILITLMGEDIKIEIDANGDGTYDQEINRTWADIDP